MFMKKENSKQPQTPATMFLKKHNIAFDIFEYQYDSGGGAMQASRELGVKLNDVVKTLILEDEQKNPLIMLMNGDAEVSLKNLARQIGVKSIKPCSHKDAQKNSGYVVGGTSPFGTRKKMPIYIEQNITTKSVIYINGGRRGLILKINPNILISLTKAITVQTIR